MRYMKAIAVGSQAAVKHGLLWHVLDLFYSSHEEEGQEMKTNVKSWDFFEDITFFESSDDFDHYVKHLYD